MYGYERSSSSMSLRNPLSKRKHKHTDFSKTPKKKFRDRFAKLSPIVKRSTPIARRRLRKDIEEGRRNSMVRVLDLNKTSIARYRDSSIITF